MNKRSIPIKVRLTAWYFFIMAVAMSALAVLALAGMEHSIRSTVQEQLTDRINLIKKLIASSPTQSPDTLNAQLRENLGPDSEEELVHVSDENGNWIFRSTRLQGRTLLAASSAAQVQKKRHPYFDAEVNGEPFHGISGSLAAGPHTYSIQVAQDMDDFEEATSRFRHLLLGVIPALLLAASLGGYWISKQALAPVDQITRAAQAISGRNLSARLVVPNSGDEVARLAETLNAMLERIDLALKQIAQFTADASHELRTPIALMRTRAELALRRPRSAAENQETIEQLHAEVVRTSELVERLMLLARADSGASLLRFETVDLAQLVQDVLAQTSVLAQHKQLELEASLASVPVLVHGDAQFLRQLFVILIDNAVKYTSAPGTVTVTLSKSNGSACLSVSDTGMGIEATDLENIFGRFYRADKARSRETGGAGLGLAIGRWIAESHRGTLTAESKPGAGSTFSVHLPRQGTTASDLSG
jgi:heavy metal sensor kinase